VDRLTLEPVGIIFSEHRDPARAPIQPVCAQGSGGRVEVFPQFAQALDDIEGFSHCVFRLKPNTDSAASRTLIPLQAEH